MLLSVTSPDQVAALYCVPWNPYDSLLPLYDQLSNQFDTDSDPSLKAILMVALQNQMMLYRKANCTDCATQGLPPTQTVINPPSSSGAVAPAGIVQTNITDQLALQGSEYLQQGIGAIGTFAQVGSSLARAVPILGDVASVITDVIGIFSQHHAQAVAEEQAVNCGVANAFNKWIPRYDAAVASGSIDPDVALTAITQLIQSQLIPALSPVISGHNWGWSASQALACHLAFRQQWYPILKSNSSVLGGITSNPLLVLAVVGLGVILLGSPKEA